MLKGNPARRIETPRLVLRCWEEDEAPLFLGAVHASLPELRAWIPWDLDQPAGIDGLEDRFHKFRYDFEAGRQWTYGIFDSQETEALGGVGLYPRVGPGALEVGYWLRTDATGRGYVTEAVKAVTREAFACGAERVLICCDPLNVPSVAVPRRLGFRETGVHKSDRPVNGRIPDIVTWELAADEQDRLES